jgi:hypothetical protein
MRENARAKANRYLAEGRLTVLRVDRNVVAAECRGAGAVYRVGFEDGTWSCSCPARGACCHLHALQAVTVREAL